MSGYTIAVERFTETYAELEPLYREHYAEMQARLLSKGIATSDYNPRISEYIKADKGGWLLSFVLRHDGAARGYGNVYITNDMHNGDLIAQEDTIFVTKSHRNGIGRKLMKFGLDELRKRNVRRGYVSAVTDLRVAKLWRRMGFEEVAVQMVYAF